MTGVSGEGIKGGIALNPVDVIFTCRRQCVLRDLNGRMLSTGLTQFPRD